MNLLSLTNRAFRLISLILHIVLLLLVLTACSGVAPGIDTTGTTVSQESPPLQAPPETATPGRTVPTTPTPEATRNVASENVRCIPSPDGRWTALLDEEAGSLALEPSDREAIPVFEPGSTVSAVEWSPDSHRLLVVQRNWQWEEPGETPRAEQPLQLWQVRLWDNEVEPPQMVFQSPVYPGEPGYLPEQLQFGHWSPDVRHVLFWVGPTGPSFLASGLSLWVLDVEMGRSTQLAEEALLNPRYQSWAPDSSALAFTAGGNRSAQVNKWLNLFNPATGQVTTVVSKTEAIPGIVAWSPYGDLIAYVAVLASETGMDWADWMSFENPAILKRRVYVLNPKTGEHWRLNSADAFQDAPTWSDGGKILYYVQREGDSMVLMKTNPYTGEGQVVEGTRRPAPRAVGYYGQSDWDDLLAYRPDAPRATVPSFTEVYPDLTVGYTLRYPEGWYVDQGWRGCPQCHTFGPARLDGASPNFGPFSGKAFIAIQVVENPEADLDALLHQVLATAGPGQILDRGALLIAFDQQELMVDGRPAVRLETMGEFGKVNHLLVVLEEKRALILQGQGDERVFDAIVGTLKLR